MNINNRKNYQLNKYRNQKKYKEYNLKFDFVHYDKESLLKNNKKVKLKCFFQKLIWFSNILVLIYYEDY